MNRLPHLMIALGLSASFVACGAQDPDEDMMDDTQVPSNPGKADMADEANEQRTKFTGELAWLEEFCEDDDLFGPVFSKCYSGVEMMRRTYGQKKPTNKQRFYYPASEMFGLSHASPDPNLHVRVVYCMHDVGCEYPEEYVEVIVPEHWGFVLEEPNNWKVILRKDFHIQQYEPKRNELVDGTQSTEPYRGGDGKGFFWVLFNAPQK